VNARIRQADIGDLSALRSLLEDLTGKELDQEVVEDRLRMVQASSIDELYVLEDEHGIQGLLGFRVRENIEERSSYGEVSALVTRPSARRSGYGGALMAFAEQLAKKRGCKGTWLVSGFGREADAHKFYAGLGYEVTGYRFVKPIE
jgi:GNAT superfamily N-acetyltransferase